MAKRIRALLLCCGMVAVAVGLAPSAAAAFGTVNFHGQHAEHERITRIALECRAGQPDNDGSCFQRASLANVAGATVTANPPTSSSFGAVGAADDQGLRMMWGGPYYWHCDDADYLDVPGYPQTRAQATVKLLACRNWARGMLLYGLPDRDQQQPTGIHRPIPRTWPVTGAVDEARNLLTNGRVDVSDPGTRWFSRTCTFDGKLGRRAKCNVWEPWGYVLHAAEDFYSHGNWADQANPNDPIGVKNPPGLAHRDLPAFWDLRDASAALPDPQLSTGCYPEEACHGRIDHDTLSKDNEIINVTTGLVTDPSTPRGRVLSNAQRAVNGAIGEAKRQWAILRWELIDHYGAEKGGKMICALTSDTANESCNDARKAVDVFAKIPPSYTTIASVQNPNKCLDLYKNEVTPGAVIRNYDCNGTAAQQFQFAGETVQFTSVGSSRALRLRGKCLDGITAVAAVYLSHCDGSAFQQVTVTAAGELQLDNSCITAEPENTSLAPLRPCTGADDQLWQFR